VKLIKYKEIHNFLLLCGYQFSMRITASRRLPCAAVVRRRRRPCLGLSRHGGAPSPARLRLGRRCPKDWTTPCRLDSALQVVPALAATATSGSSAGNRWSRSCLRCRDHWRRGQGLPFALGDIYAPWSRQSRRHWPMPLRCGSRSRPRWEDAVWACRLHRFPRSPTTCFKPGRCQRACRTPRQRSSHWETLPRW
jgi:hypothetical protein